MANPATPEPDSALQPVMVVDDDEDALEILVTFLKCAGHEVVVAHDGPAALAALDRFRPTAAVIDIGMPVMDGYELAACIRARRDGEQPFLVALTGYSQIVDRERGSAAGFDEHLVKPVDLPRLLRVLAGARPPRAISEGAAE